MLFFFRFIKKFLFCRQSARYTYVYFFLFLLFYSLEYGGLSARAQVNHTIKKAEAYYNNYEYSKAIPLYKKASDKNDDALRKLAECYRIIKNYPEAEIAYGKLVSKNSVNPLDYYYYGEALLSNNKFEEAKKQFILYSTLNPTDKKGTLYIKACDNIKDILVKPALYKVYNLGEINSAVSDFCPVFYKEGMVFASERIRDLVNNSKNNWTGNSYLSIVFSKEEKLEDSVIYETANLFLRKLSGDGHYGPACFNTDYSEIYFTKVDKVSHRQEEIMQPKLYWSKNENGWSNPIVLPFSSNEYATGHPSISKDGQYLYFASNMAGGKGGTDIWFSKREGGAWTAPQNLGEEINTTADETFPYISPANILYFSSNGHAGFGGLDLFTATQKDDKWGNVSNMMPPVNSTGDDFGITLKGDNHGYFSSNRSGGKGSDDLYGFAPSGLIASISGKILLSNNAEDGAQNVKVFLLTDKGIIMQTTSTDTSGFFQFSNLLTEQTYMVRIDESDPSLINQKKFYLADAQNKVVQVVVKNKEGFFIFENLPSDLSKLSQLIEHDPSLKTISIAGNLYAGEQRSPIENTKVNLINSREEVVQTTVTNAFGSFVFRNISPDENLTMELDNSDPALASQKIYFTNKSGTEVATGQGGKFTFTILASDKNTLSLLLVEDSQLLVDIKGTLVSDKEGKDGLSNLSLHLIDEKGNVVKTLQTDTLGNFKFINLPVDKSYLVRLKEDEPSASLSNVFLADANGRIVLTLKAGGTFFRYSVLPMDEQSLTKIYFDDPWLKAAKMQSETRKDSLMTIIENVYYEYQKWNLLPQTIITLNKVIEVMKVSPDITVDLISHTDSRGSNSFNMMLSQKRAQKAVDYIISRGITKNRLVAKGMGELQLVNQCKDGVECSEEDHAQNRRSEFKVKKGSK